MDQPFSRCSVVGCSLLVLALGVLGGGCHPQVLSQQWPPADKEGALTPEELERRYAEVWMPMGSPPPEKIELVHLGIPDTTRLVVWHAYARVKSQAPSVAFREGEGETWTSVAECVDRATNTPCYERSDAAGQVLKGSALPAPDMLTERIVLQGLQPGTGYWVKINDKERPARTKPGAGPARKVSFLALSCNNPFTFKEGLAELSRTRPSILEQDRINSLALLQERARGEIKLAGFPAQPSFALALGDQIYVDGDNDFPWKTRTHPLALFQGSESLGRFDPAQSSALLDIIYRYHFAMPSLDGALSALPTAMVWDDHDIRDGWGTRADDNTPGMQLYFQSARRAFLGYQMMRNPNFSADLAVIPPPPSPPPVLDTDFDWGPQIRVKLLDGRTNRRNDRDRALPTPMISPAQWVDLERWLNTPSLSTPTVFVLGLASPLMSIAKTPFELANVCQRSNKDFGIGETADDIRDTWMCHEQDREKLVDLLVNHFHGVHNHRLLIVSGDVHYSSVTYLQTPDGQVIGHEIISSGVTNDHVKTGPEKLGVFDAGEVSGETASEPSLVTQGSGTNRLLGVAAGALFGTPSFAEVRVSPAGPHGAPGVSVVFFPSNTSRRGDGDRQIVNPAARLKGKLLHVEAYNPETQGCTPRQRNTIVRSDLAMDKAPDVMKKKGIFCLQAESEVCVTDTDSTSPATSWDGPTGDRCDRPRLPKRENAYDAIERASWP